MDTHSDADTFKYQDASSYDSVTEEFDRFTTLLAAPFATRMITLAELKQGNRVLDVGAGTGAVAFRATEAVGATGRIIGIDLSTGMLAMARDKASQRSLNARVEFRRMDAEALELQEQSFDSVLSLFALLHFPYPLLALQEMFRVLKPGGTLVIAVGSGPPWLSVRGLWHRVKRAREVGLQLQGKRLFAPRFLDTLVKRRLPAGAEPEESALARKHHTRTHHVPRLIEQAGFIDLRFDWTEHTVYAATPEEFWDLQQTFSSFSRKRLSSAPPEQIHELRQEFLKTCQMVQARGGKLVYPFGAFYVAARRP